MNILQFLSGDVINSNSIIECSNSINCTLSGDSQLKTIANRSKLIDDEIIAIDYNQSNAIDFHLGVLSFHIQLLDPMKKI